MAQVTSQEPCCRPSVKFFLKCNNIDKNFEKKIMLLLLLF